MVKSVFSSDHQARRRFVEWAQNEIAVVPDFHKRILFSDEAHFWLNGYVNKQNCCIWSEANPQVPVNWPPSSSDLTPLDYFLWGYGKSLVYADKPQTLDHLEDNIRRVIADIRLQMLEKVIENWTSRLDYIRASRGSSESLGTRRFLNKINDVAELGKWYNAEKVTILKLKLMGIAEEFFLSDPTNSQLTNFDDIAQVIISRFERTVPLSIRLQLFSSCLQGVSESVQEFAARIKKLSTQIFPSGNSVQTTAARNTNDQLLQSHFISGLRNDIRRFVLAQDPNTL
ncbi:transposable element Tc3 transposase [Trichonephila clavipes]|nr:transposable element Tc3 transposase [Trichonephila clavipes]